MGVDGGTMAKVNVFGRIVLVIGLSALVLSNSFQSHSGPRLVAECIAILLCAAVLLLRRLPWQVAPAAVTVAMLGLSDFSLTVFLMVVLFDLAAWQHVKTAVGCAVAVLSINALTDLVRSSWQPSLYLSAALALLVCILAGLWLGIRRRMVQLLAEQVEHLKVEAALREETARIRERSRIATDMHDVLAHRLSLIALHTGVLVTRGDDIPEQIADRLRLLRTTSTAAMADLRDVLGALHSTEPGTGDRGVAPITGQVQQLVDEARATGQSVELVVEGDPERVPTTHRLAVYRVVQEALTNARKHAAGAPVTARVDYGPPQATTEITNTAGSTAAGVVGSGYGLVGLRARLTALGGTLQAGPAGAGSWTVTARIPRPTGPAQNGPAS